MGYRSDGYVYLSDEAYEVIGSKGIESLYLKKYKDNIWKFNGLKRNMNYDISCLLEGHNVNWDCIRFGEGDMSVLEDIEVSTGYAFNEPIKKRLGISFER